MADPEPCEHLRAATDHVANTPAGCEDCLRLGASWVKARLCRTCGHVGCCDSSNNQHATKHYQASHHAVIDSFEPGDHCAGATPTRVTSPSRRRSRELP